MENNWQLNLTSCIAFLALLLSIINSIFRYREISSKIKVILLKEIMNFGGLEKSGIKIKVYNQRNLPVEVKSIEIEILDHQKISLRSDNWVKYPHNLKGRNDLPEFFLDEQFKTALITANIFGEFYIRAIVKVGNDIIYKSNKLKVSF